MSQHFTFDGPNIAIVTNIMGKVQSSWTLVFYNFHSKKYIFIIYKYLSKKITN